MVVSNLKKPFYSTKLCSDSVSKKEGMPINEAKVKRKALNNDEIVHLVGANIRTIRKSNKITINTLASNAKISSKYLQGVEVGKRNISITNLNKIANVLNIPISMFFQNEGTEKNKQIFLIAGKFKNYSKEQLTKLIDMIDNLNNITAE